MRWGTIARLYRRRLGARLGQELFAFLGVAIGVALLFAVQVSNASLGRSIGDLSRGLVGKAQLQLVARDTRGFDERLADVVARSPGVEGAAPVLQVSANLVGPRGERPVLLLAADERVGDLGGTVLGDIGLPPLPRLRAVVVPSEAAHATGVRAGGAARLQVAGRTARVPVAATLGAGVGGTLAAAPVVLAPLRFGQALAGADGRVSRLYVRARPGHEARVRRLLARLAVDRLDVRAADFDERVFAQASVPNDQSSSLFSQVAALVGFLFALNAMLLMARDRRRLIATMRLAGHSARTLRRLLLLDALVLGLVASCAGLALGELLSRGVFAPAPGYLTIGFPVGTARSVDASAFAVAFAAGMLATLLGTFVPLAQQRLDPVGDDGAEAEDGRHPLRVRPRWLAGAAVALAGTVAVWFLIPQAASVAIGLLLVALILCLPGVLSLTLRLCAWATRRARTPVAALAIGELRANGTRSVVLAGVAAIAVFASGAIEGARRDLQAGLDTSVRGVSRTTDVWVSPASGSNQLGVATFVPTVRSAIARLPAVAGVDVYRGELLTIGERRMWVFAPPAASRRLVPAAQVLDGDPAVANRLVRDAGQAAVSAAFAEEHDLRVGSSYTIPAPHPIRVRVAAIISNLGWPPGAIVLDTRHFDAGWGTGEASALQVRLRPGITPARGRDLVARALARTPWTGLTVETAAERERHQRQSARDGLVRLQQISRLVLLTTALALAIALGAMVLERSRGLATLKLSGIRRGRLRRALLLETALLLAAGCTAGAVFALAGTQLLDRWLTTLTGFPVERSGGALAALVSLATVLLVALLATAIPVYRAADVAPAAAFQD